MSSSEVAAMVLCCEKGLFDRLDEIIVQGRVLRRLLWPFSSASLDFGRAEMTEIKENRGEFQAPVSHFAQYCGGE